MENYNYTPLTDKFNWVSFSYDTRGTEYGYYWNLYPLYYPSDPVTYSPIYPWNWKPEIRKVKRITRTIEKYDKHGKYKGKEVITEEEEIYDKEVWGTEITYKYTINDNVYDVNIVIGGEPDETKEGGNFYFDGSRPTLTEESFNGPISSGVCGIYNPGLDNLDYQISYTSSANSINCCAN